MIEVDKEWRKCRFQLEQLLKDANAIGKEVSQRKKKDPKDECAVGRHEGGREEGREPDE